MGQRVIVIVPKLEKRVEPTRVVELVACNELGPQEVLVRSILDAGSTPPLYIFMSVEISFDVSRISQLVTVGRL